MAIRVKNAVARIVASGGGSVAPMPGQSLLIKRIFCLPSASDTYLKLFINATQVGVVRVKGLGGNHAPYPAQGATGATEPSPLTLFDRLEAAGHPLSYPIEEDEVFTITRFAQAGDVTVIYDIGDAGDYKASDPNGSASKLQRFLMYGSNAAAITAIGDCLIDAPLSAGLTATFPINRVRVLNGCKGRILGIAGVPSAKGAAAANNFYTTYVKLRLNSAVLFDVVNQAGFAFLGDVTNVAGLAWAPIASVIGGNTAENAQGAMLCDPPIELTPDDILEAYVTVAGVAAAAFAIGSLDLCFITEFERP